jgi:hypothetical protein
MIEPSQHRYASRISRAWPFCLNMISAQTRSALVARKNRFMLFRIML